MPAKLSNITDDILEQGVRPASDSEQANIEPDISNDAEEQVQLYLAQPNVHLVEVKFQINSNPNFYLDESNSPQNFVISGFILRMY